MADELSGPDVDGRASPSAPEDHPAPAAGGRADDAVEDRPGATTDDVTTYATDDATTDEREPEWWEDPRMPWKGKPGRQDLLCWGGFSLTGVYSLASLPFRPLLLAGNPLLLCGLTGSRTAVVTVGALAAVGRMDWWWVGLILATLSFIKFDALFWWAGKLWGRGLIEIIAGRSARAARSAARAEKLAERYGVAAMLITYVVPLVPRAVVYASVGAAGMRLRIFLLVDFVGSLLTRCLYMYLGYAIGQPAVDVFDTIAKYSLYLSLALVVVVFVSVLRQQKKGAAPTAR